MATLNNNQINTVLNSVYEQITGTAPESQITMQNIIDTGNDSTIMGSKEQFTKALINVLVKNWFTDSSYRSEYSDLFFQDEERFGAITQMISIEAPDVQESHAWKDITSGTTKLGEYTIFLPIIHTQYYGRSVSYELPIAVTYNQWDSAVKSEDGLRELIDYVLLAVDNKLAQHLEDLDMLNRNNFMAEKIEYSESDDATGVHVVNLVKEYHDATGSNIDTAEEFLSDPDALRFASGRLGLYMDYMRKQTALFNTEGIVRFTPKDRLVVQILSDFKTRVDSVALSTTFNDKYVELPKHQTVPYWQAPDDGVNDPLSFDAVSSINVKTATSNTAITKSGIVAFFCDQWAILHTLIKQRVAVTNFDPEAITQYYYQFTDRYMNNLTLNSIVFTVEDITITT